MSTLLRWEEKINLALRELYRRYGYAPFRMSKFEPYELYMQNKDFLVSDGIISFTDTDGTLMALKPDVTLSIVKNYQSSLPVQKVHYSENVYRIAGGSRTYREIMQTGLECLGRVGLYEISEVILLAARSLEIISPAFVLDLSHMQIVFDLLDSLALTAEQRQQALQAIADKNEDLLDQICQQLPEQDAQTLSSLIRLCGPIEQVLPALPSLCRTQKANAALQQLRCICGVLMAYGMQDKVQIDFSLVNDMNYYNGIVFRGCIEGIPSGVLSGGQYDKLMEKMGKNACGIGFAVYLDQLERLDNRKKDFDVDTVVLYSEEDDIVALSHLADRLSNETGSVVLLRTAPQNIRFRRLMRFQEGRLISLETYG